jgi:histidine triad (HIT) family protein
MDDCIFCKIVKGELPSTNEYEDENVLAIKNIEPVAETHLLIIPKAHRETFLDLDQNIGQIFEVAQKIVKNKNLTGGYKLVINGGKYQSVPHFHLHLLAGKLEDDSDILNQT